MRPYACSTNKNLTFACLYKLNQHFDIIEVIIISNNSLPVINNAVFFIFFKTVQQSFNSIPFGKQSKSIRFDFGK